MSVSKAAFLLTWVLSCVVVAAPGVSAATYFLDDAAVAVSGNFAPSGNNFIVDGMWAHADSSAWAPWNTLQPGHEFFISGTVSNAGENTSANPATVELDLGDGTYENISFLVFSHGFHQTVPPTAAVDVVAEGTALGAVSENFAASVDIQSGSNRFNWVTLPDSYEVSDGKLTLVFGDATSVNGAWYTIGQLQADFTPIPEPATMALLGLGVVAACGLRRRRM